MRKRLAFVACLAAGLASGVEAETRCLERELASSRPAAWSSRLVSEGPERIKVRALTGAGLRGAVVVGPDGLLGGLVSATGSSDDDRAFVIDAVSATDALATLENLYALVLRSETGGRYRFSAFDDCQTSTAAPLLSQSMLLREIGRRRNEVASRLRLSAAVKAWHLVTLRPATTTDASSDEARAVIEDAGRPLPGVRIVFSRAPHAGCTATSDDAGLAHCVLVDSHGDAHDDEQVPVIATFTGQFLEDGVRPPLSAEVRQGLQPATRMPPDVPRE